MDDAMDAKRPPGRPRGAKNGPKVKPKVVINGSLVHTLRLNNGWSQAELGRRCYLTQAQVSAIEGGDQTSPVDTCFFLSNAFKVPMGDLVQVVKDEG